MLEMLVAVAATLIMVLFLNQIFAAMSAAVAAGKSTSVLLENSRVITPQLVKDAQEMVGPGDNGVLVIINRRIPGDINGDGTITTSAGERDLRLTRDSGAAIAGFLRADQVMWIRYVSGNESLVPGNTTSYSADAAGATYSRVWYGHGLRTMGDGSDPAPAFQDLGVQTADNPNRYPTNWVLSRQELFLSPNVTNPGRPQAEGAWVFADINGYKTSGDPNAPPFANASVSGQLFNGIADIADYGLFDENPNNGAMLGGDEPTPNTDLNKNFRVYTSLSAQDYRDRIYNFVYTTQRLRVNPDPLYPAPLVAWGQDPYEAWQIAQMHPFLSDHVIDFRVQFAGDYDAAAGVDTWDHDGLPGTPQIVCWYDINADGLEPPAGPPLPLGGGAKQILTAATGGTPPPQRPIYDTAAITPARAVAQPHADAAFIFRHGNNADTNWPYLIRFQYRVIDARGTLVGGDGRPGKVFEQVIQVKRD